MTLSARESTGGGVREDPAVTLLELRRVRDRREREPVVAADHGRAIPLAAGRNAAIGIRRTVTQGAGHAHDATREREGIPDERGHRLHERKVRLAAGLEVPHVVFGAHGREPPQQARVVPGCGAVGTHVDEREEQSGSRRSLVLEELVPQISGRLGHGARVIWRRDVGVPDAVIPVHHIAERNLVEGGSAPIRVNRDRARERRQVRSVERRRAATRLGSSRPDRRRPAARELDSPLTSAAAAAGAHFLAGQVEVPRGGSGIRALAGDDEPESDAEESCDSSHDDSGWGKVLNRENFFLYHGAEAPVKQIGCRKRYEIGGQPSSEGPPAGGRLAAAPGVLSRIGARLDRYRLPGELRLERRFRRAVGLLDLRQGGGGIRQLARPHPLLEPLATFRQRVCA